VSASGVGARVDDELRGMELSGVREFLDEGAEHYAKFKNKEL